MAVKKSPPAATRRQKRRLSSNSTFPPGSIPWQKTPTGKYRNKTEFLIAEASFPADTKFGQVWSYRNDETQTIIIAAPKKPNPDGSVLVNHKGHWETRGNMGPYTRAEKLLRLVTESGYQLQTFPDRRDLGDRHFTSVLTTHPGVTEKDGVWIALPPLATSASAVADVVTMEEEFRQWLGKNSKLAPGGINRYARELRLDRKHRGSDNPIYRDLIAAIGKESLYEIQSVSEFESLESEIRNQLDIILSDKAIDPILRSIIKPYGDFLRSRNGNGDRPETTASDSTHQKDDDSHHSDTDSRNQDEEEIRNDPNIPDTEKQAHINARRGQGKFRDDLLRRYRGKCPVTGICVPEALIASHIKPWRDCTGDDKHKERLDPANGILLAAHVDRLFDQGYISLTVSGKILLSEQLSAEECEKFGLKKGMKINISDDMLTAMRRYLKHHRDNIYKDRKK